MAEKPYVGKHPATYPPMSYAQRARIQKLLSEKSTKGSTSTSTSTSIPLSEKIHRFLTRLILGADFPTYLQLQESSKELAKYYIETLILIEDLLDSLTEKETEIKKEID